MNVTVSGGVPEVCEQLWQLRFVPDGSEEEGGNSIVAFWLHEQIKLGKVPIEVEVERVQSPPVTVAAARADQAGSNNASPAASITGNWFTLGHVIEVMSTVEERATHSRPH